MAKKVSNTKINVKGEMISIGIDVHKTTQRRQKRHNSNSRENECVYKID